MAVNIGPKIGIDGEDEFRKEINNLISQQRVLASEMKAVTSAFDQNDRSQEKLTDQAKVLEKQVKNQKDRLDLLNDGLEKSKKELGENDKVTQRWQQAVYDATTQLNKLERELNDVKSGLDETGNATNGLDGELGKAADAAEEAGKSFSVLGDVVGGNLIAGGISQIANGVKQATEETKEYRKIMASLETSSQKAGYSAEQTADVYKTLFGVLADDQTAATTTANLQALGLEQKDLMDITNATIGAWATYGDSIPIDGLGEAINETIKTGKVTGTFADVLNWAGTSEDEFNVSLSKTNNTTERARIVMQELTRQGLDKAGRAWQENNKSLVEANRATSDQQDAMAELGKVAEPILTEITKSTTAFINFIVDNKDVVIAGIAGIGGAFAAWKISGILEGVIKKVKALNTAMGAGATLGGAFKSALSGNVFGIAATGIGALAGVIAAVASNAKGAKTEIDQMTEETKELKEAAKETRDVMGTSVEAVEDAAGKMEASSVYAAGLADELYDLAGATDRSAGEQDRMESIVAQLNSMFPDLALSINETTGALNMGEEELDQYLNTVGKMEKLKYLQESYADAIDDVVDAEIARTEMEMEAAKWGDKITELEEKRNEIAQATIDKQEESAEAQRLYNEGLKTGAENLNELYAKANDTSEAVVEYNGKMYLASEAMRLVTEDIALATEQQDGLNTAIDEQQKKVDEANAGLAPYNEMIKTYTEDINAATNAQNGQNESMRASIEVAGQASQAFNQMSQDEQQLAIDATNAFLTLAENTQGAIQSQMDMFSAFDAGVQLSTEDLLANMQSQVDGVKNWEQNLIALAQSGIDDGLLQHLMEMGPQGAGYVQTFASMTTDELSSANDLWKQSVDIKGMTDEWGQKLLNTGAESIQRSMGGLEGVLESSGANTVMGLVKGMIAAQGEATNQGKDLGIKTIDSINKALGVASPSTKAKQAGIYVDSGLSGGMQFGQSVVNTTAKNVGDGAIRALQNAMNPSIARGYGINMAYALAGGIDAGRSRVISAAANMAAAAISAAKRKLEIHSPSRVFENMGENSTNAYALGAENREADMKRRLQAVLDMGYIGGLVSSIGTIGIEPTIGGNVGYSVGDTTINIYAAEGQSEEQIADAVMYRLQREVAQREAVFGR